MKKLFKQYLAENLVGIFVFGIIGLTIVYASIMILGSDNPVEEAIEEYVKEEYKIELDFSK